MFASFHNYTTKCSSFRRLFLPARRSFAKISRHPGKKSQTKPDPAVKLILRTRREDIDDNFADTLEKGHSLMMTIEGMATDKGTFGAAERFYLELSEDNRRLLVERAVSIYDGRGLRNRNRNIKNQTACRETLSV